jgi:LmbE family N-acetylglucosaminyl deacetylase
MLPIQLNSLRTILCLGAHSDDIEIGCGGTLLKLLADKPDLNIHWVVFSAPGERAAEATASAKALAGSNAKLTIELHEFPDTCFPFVGLEIKAAFRKLQQEVQPDLVFTHRREDAHQDHRLLAELTWNAFRNHLIWEYEIPKYEGDLGAPNVFVQLDESTARRKCDHVLKHFPSQQTKPWFRRETFEAVMRLRAIECNSPTGFAEAFYCRKAILA